MTTYNNDIVWDIWWQGTIKRVEESNIVRTDNNEFEIQIFCIYLWALIGVPNSNCIQNETLHFMLNTHQYYNFPLGFYTTENTIEQEI